jgi:putative ABC transport system ATP-binding protein
MDEPAIQCKGIAKSYGIGEMRIDALKGIDIEIYAGQLTLLVGPSGSGKTTLLSIITNILTPDAGQFLLLGKDMSQMTDDERSYFCRENLGIIFQSLFLIPTLTVQENVSLPMLLAGDSQKTANEKALKALKTVNIANRYHHAPGNLSKGQQQRVAIARAIVHDAKIIICDEPTSALDQRAGFEIMTVLKELATKYSKAVLVVTHDHRIFSFADRIIYISDGQIIPGEGT